MFLILVRMLTVGNSEKMRKNEDVNKEEKDRERIKRLTPWRQIPKKKKYLLVGQVFHSSSVYVHNFVSFLKLRHTHVRLKINQQTEGNYSFYNGNPTNVFEAKTENNGFSVMVPVLVQTLNSLFPHLCFDEYIKEYSTKLTGIPRAILETITGKLISAPP